VTIDNLFSSNLNTLSSVISSLGFDITKLHPDKSKPAKDLIRLQINTAIYAHQKRLPVVSLQIPYETSLSDDDCFSVLSDFRHSIRSSFSPPFLRRVHTNIFRLLQISSQEAETQLNRPSSLVIYGLNNPYFLESLLKKVSDYKPSYVAFVDHESSNILTTLSTTNWSKIQSLFLKNGIVSNFFFGDTPEEALQQFSNWVCKFSLYDAFNFQYYVDPIFNEAAKVSIPILQNPSIYQKAITRGFIEDNLNMVVNSLDAFQEASHSNNVSFISFNPQPSISLRTPAVLAASGPSLSSSLDFLKSHPEYPVFCAGSAVTSLIQSGIKPQYCVLVERNESVYKKHLSCSEFHSKLKDITLIAATSVDYRIFKFYKDVYLYTRDSNPLSSHTIPNNLLAHTHPTSVNAALSVMINLNITDILLAGVDFSFSTREYTRHKHAHGNGSYKASYAVTDYSNRTVFSESSLLRSYQSALLTMASHAHVVLYNKSRPLLLPSLSPPDSFTSLEAKPIYLSSCTDFPQLKHLSMLNLRSELDKLKSFLMQSAAWIENSWQPGTCCPFTTFHNYIYLLVDYKLPLTIVYPSIFELILCYSRSFSLLSKTLTDQTLIREKSYSLFSSFLDESVYMLCLALSVLADYERK